eukprot:Tbor_TRINITY_DN5577_c4_g11::TRINITY_DN5577_c4_g11_i1::g.12714::m.12714
MESDSKVESSNVENVRGTVDQIANAIEEVAARVNSSAASVNPKLTGTQGHPHKILAGLDMGILFAAASELVLFATSSEYVYFGIWWLMCLAVIGKCAFSLHLSGVFARADVKRFLTSVDGLFLIISLTFTFLFTDAIIFIAIAIGIHALLDLVNVQRPALRIIIPDFEKHAGAYCDKLDSNTQKKINLVAAFLEIVSVFIAPFYGGFITFCIYLAFLALRYRSDASSREAFSYVDNAIDSLVKLPQVPPQVRENYKKVKDVLEKNLAA